MEKILSGVPSEPIVFLFTPGVVAIIVVECRSKTYWVLALVRDTIVGVDTLHRNTYHVNIFDYLHIYLLIRKSLSRRLQWFGLALFTIALHRSAQESWPWALHLLEAGISRPPDHHRHRGRRRRSSVLLHNLIICLPPLNVYIYIYEIVLYFNITHIDILHVHIYIYYTSLCMYLCIYNLYMLQAFRSTPGPILWE